MNAGETGRAVGRHCPQCGAPLSAGALDGLCPACLLQQGVAAESAVAGVAAAFQPPNVEEVARWFPQLEVLSFIGKGGMGAVYKARQPGLDRLVALKILPVQVAADPGFAERFAREARALAKLSHPNIVTVHESGQVNGLPYFLMEYVDGLNLRAVERAGRLSPREALEIVPQICEALQFAHEEGIVHRDIKPENILLDKKGRVKIADFGIAKIMGASAPASAAVSGGDVGATTGAGIPPVTSEGKVIGTPNYMAPEQVEKPEAVDHRADIYSLGVVFYEMLTGELPLGRFAPPSSRTRGAAVDARLDEVVLRALEKEPGHRYQQASQVRTAVKTISGNTGPPPPGRFNRRVAWIAALIAFCLVMWWATDELNGLMSVGLVSRWSGDGDAQDVRGRNNGTPVNVDFVPGKVRSAFQIKGPGSHVTIPDDPSLNLRKGMAVDAWIYPTGPHGPNAAIVSKAGATGGYSLEYEPATGGVRFGVCVDTPLLSLPLGRGTFTNFMDHLRGVHHRHWVFSPFGPPPLRNVWTHVAGVYDGSNVSFYMNGALVGGSPATGRILASTNDLEIGGTQNIPSRYFTGKIDEVSLYRRALSKKQIRAVYQADMAESREGGLSAPFIPAEPIIKTTNNLWDLGQGTTVTRTSGLHEPASDMRDMFGGRFSSVEPGNTVFADGRSAGFVHFIEWQTSMPVTVDSFALFASGDGPQQALPAQREFSRFVLKARSSATADDYDLTLYTLAISNHPYVFQDTDTSALLAAKIKPVTAQFFRAEFTQYNAGGGSDGPRVIGLEGFGPSKPAPVNRLDYPAATNLAGWWRAGFDANDSSGKGNHGTLLGGALYTGGMTGRALSLDGSTQYIEVPDSPSLNPTTSLTLAAWIRPVNFPYSSPVIKKAGIGWVPDAGYALEVAGSDGAICCVYVNGAWAITGYAPVPLNQWSHIAGVYDGTNVSVYVNGELVGTPVYAPGRIMPSDNNLQIGHDFVNQSRFFDGLIDDARVYNRALSPEEIRELYREGSGGG